MKTLLTLCVILVSMQSAFGLSKRDVEQMNITDDDGDSLIIRKSRQPKQDKAGQPCRSNYECGAPLQCIRSSQNLFGRGVCQ